MREVNIPRSGLMYYTTKEDVLNDDSDPNREAYLEIFSIMEKISRILNVTCPDLSIAESIRQRNEYTGQLSDMCAMLFTPADVPGLPNNVIQLSLEHFKPLPLSGIIAHEIRHIWQEKYKPELNKVHAQGYTDSLNHPAEIDADGFAICLLALNKIPLEQAGEVVCPEEKKLDPTAYKLRIDKAKEIMKEIENQNVNRKGNFFSFFKQLIRKIFK